MIKWNRRKINHGFTMLTFGLLIGGYGTKSTRPKTGILFCWYDPHYFSIGTNPFVRTKYSKSTDDEQLLGKIWQNFRHSVDSKTWTFPSIKYGFGWKCIHWTFTFGLQQPKYRVKIVRSPVCRLLVPRAACLKLRLNEY